jgi:hypothetical protein
MAGMAFPVHKAAHAQPGQKAAFPLGLMPAIKKPQHPLAPMPLPAPSAPAPAAPMAAAAPAAAGSAPGG